MMGTIASQTALGEAAVPELDAPQKAPPVEVRRVASRPVPSVRTQPLAFRERWWVGPLMVLTDWVALEIALIIGFVVRGWLAPIVPIRLSLELHYLPLAISVLVMPLGFLLVGLYPGFGVGMVERLRQCWM